MNLFHSVEIDGEEEGEHVSWASHNQSRGINTHNVSVRRGGLKHVIFDRFFDYTGVSVWLVKCHLLQYQELPLNYQPF